MTTAELLLGVWAAGATLAGGAFWSLLWIEKRASEMAVGKVVADLEALKAAVEWYGTLEEKWANASPEQLVAAHRAYRTRLYLGGLYARPVQ